MIKTYLNSPLSQHIQYLLCTMFSITSATTTPTPLYVFSQVISLPEGMEVVVDQEFIRNAEELIQDQYDRGEDAPEEREQRSWIVSSSPSFPLVSPSGSEDTTLPIIILSIVGAVLGGTLAVLVRVLIQFYRGHKDNTETGGCELMREKLASLREARDRLDYYGAGRGRTENVYVSNSVII